jgi:integrase
MSAGRIFRRKKNGVERGPYWIAYYGPGVDGAIVEHRESTDTLDEKRAGKILRDRLAAVGAVKFGGDEFIRPRRVLVNDLLDDLEVDLAGKAYARTARSHAKNLRRLLGASDVRRVNWRTVKDYTTRRLSEVADRAPDENKDKATKDARATVDHETALLIRAFRLGKKSKKVSSVPDREALLERNGNARTLTIDAATFENLLGIIRRADDDFADWVEWFAATAMRPREISTLSHSDLVEGDGFRTITIRAENAKTREARTFPVVGPLAKIIERRLANRRIDCPLVFHANGRSFAHPSGGLPERFLRIWHAACEKVGLPMLPLKNEKRKSRRVSAFSVYLLRHHATRTLRAAGVPETVVMSITGHRSRSTFERYAIVDLTDKVDALVAAGEYVAAKKAKRSKLAVGSFGSVKNAEDDRAASESEHGHNTDTGGMIR